MLTSYINDCIYYDIDKELNGNEKIFIIDFSYEISIVDFFEQSYNDNYSFLIIEKIINNFIIGSNRFYLPNENYINYIIDLIDNKITNYFITEYGYNFEVFLNFLGWLNNYAIFIISI